VRDSGIGPGGRDAHGEHHAGDRELVDWAGDCGGGAAGRKTRRVWRAAVGGVIAKIDVRLWSWLLGARSALHAAVLSGVSGVDAGASNSPPLRGELPLLAAATSTDKIRHTPRGESNASVKDWRPGQLHPNLSWSLYRHLLRVDKPEARAFYEIEALQNNWSARELERQINSLLYERLALSRDKKGLLRLARKGQEIQGPMDVFKDPLVLEFLKIPAAAKLVESDLETALLNELQSFLLELGKGFAFVARQERITLDGDHFYIDLVFYHTILKCFVLLDLKVRKLTHEDLGQFQLYLNYYDHERRTEGDNPTLGLILCTDKNDAVVRYTLGEEQQKKIFTSRYKLHLPSEAELKAELLRELKSSMRLTGHVQFLVAGKSFSCF
jgi:predicted nuclease of restriction endonuclease-like (RecB) superfamily